MLPVEAEVLGPDPPGSGTGVDAINMASPFRGLCASTNSAGRMCDWSVAVQLAVAVPLEKLALVLPGALVAVLPGLAVRPGEAM